MSAAGGSGGGPQPSMFAITPDGERIYPDEDGVLHCTPDDTIFTIGGGGGGEWRAGWDLLYRQWAGSAVVGEKP